MWYIGTDPKYTHTYIYTIRGDFLRTLYITGQFSRISYQTK